MFVKIIASRAAKFELYYCNGKLSDVILAKR